MAKKEYIKTWTGSDGKDKAARIWIDEKGEDPTHGSGDGKPQLCWEVTEISNDTSEEEIVILNALGKGSAVSKMAKDKDNSGNSYGGSYPVESEEELAQGVKRLLEQLQG